LLQNQQQELFQQAHQQQVQAQQEELAQQKQQAEEQLGGVRSRELGYQQQVAKLMAMNKALKTNLLALSQRQQQQ
jgi:hypothetical protein